ncbi:unnamed protein product [Lathyrus sativus]|nr:unnamed protein product [Lathyrus sativus]
MASAGFGLAETYVMQKIYKEKLKKITEQEKLQEDKKFDTIKTCSMDKTSTGCFSLFPKKQQRKISRISDSNDS